MQPETAQQRDLAHADQVRQRFGWVANLVQHVAASCSALVPTGHGAVIARHPDFAAAVEVTCLDLDTAALAYARQRIEGRLDGQVQYVCENALRFARGAQRPTWPFDVIYAAGLFDYLGADLAVRLIEDCHGLLALGGMLIVGNFSQETHSSDRTLIEWLLDWRLLYRTEADFRAIFARTSFGAATLHFEHEPLRANLFAVATRP